MIKIIPAIDIIESKAVRLSGGDFKKKKVYNEDPLEVAKAFEQVGIKRLHLVDLDGARTGEVKNWKVLDKIATSTGLFIDFGGGIHSEEDVSRAFNAGASQVNTGTIPVKDANEFEMWLQRFGVEKFLIGADVKDPEIMIRGWKEASGIIIDDFIKKYMAIGINEFFCTDVSKDGMMEGPARELYARLIKDFPSLKLIASGGVRDLIDIETLEKTGCVAVIVGKALYEGRITLKQLEAYAD